MTSAAALHRMALAEGRRMRLDYEEGGLSIRALADKYGRCTRTVAIRLRRVGTAMRVSGRKSPAKGVIERDEEVVALRVAGYTQREIAETYGFTRANVHEILKRKAPNLIGPRGRPRRDA